MNSSQRQFACKIKSRGYKPKWRCLRKSIQALQRLLKKMGEWNSINCLIPLSGDRFWFLWLCWSFLRKKSSNVSKIKQNVLRLKEIFLLTWYLTINLKGYNDDWLNHVSKMERTMVKLSTKRVNHNWKVLRVKGIRESRIVKNLTGAA